MANVIKIGGGVLGAVKKQIKNAKPVVKKEAKANKRGLKAANKDVAIKYKKGYNENNYSGRNESKPKQVSKDKVRRPGNKNAPMTSPSSYKKASMNSRFMLKDKNSIVLKEAKASVKVKPAAKPVGNPSNNAKALGSYLSSAARGGVGRGPLGKAKDMRIAKSKKK